jgi:threonine aldolase
VSCCFSKGLGCPAGSALCASAETIKRARRYRKMLGGSMRQAGLLAGAALYALEHNLERIADDHTHARLLADRLAEIPGLTCDPTAVETNMVYFEVDASIGTAAELCTRLNARGVRMLAENPTKVRAVCHLGISREEIEHAGGVVAEATE